MFPSNFTLIAGGAWISVENQQNKKLKKTSRDKFLVTLLIETMIKIPSKETLYENDDQNNLKNQLKN